MSTAQESQDFYNRQLDYFSKANERHKKIYDGLKHCGLGSGRDVLDLGCGAGFTSVFMARAGCNVVAVDFAEELVRYGKEYNTNKNLEYLVADITTLCLDRKFDIIVLADVLEHVHAESLMPLMGTILDHSYYTTVIYLNVPYWPFLSFVRRHGIGTQQPIDNVLPLTTILNLFENINYWPVHMDFYGLGTPVEYIEAIFARKEDVLRAWEEYFREIGVLVTEDDPKGSPIEGEEINASTEEI